MAKRKKVEPTPAPEAPQAYGLGIAHIETKISVKFGVLNRDGDTDPKRERHFLLADLKPASFEVVRRNIEQFRGELLQEFCLPPAVAAPEPPAADPPPAPPADPQK